MSGEARFCSRICLHIPRDAQRDDTSQPPGLGADITIFLVFSQGTLFPILCQREAGALNELSKQLQQKVQLVAHPVGIYSDGDSSLYVNGHSWSSKRLRFSKRFLTIEESKLFPFFLSQIVFFPTLPLTSLAHYNWLNNTANIN
jgi:hypothetical protein